MLIYQYYLKIKSAYKILSIKIKQKSDLTSSKYDNLSLTYLFWVSKIY